MAQQQQSQVQLNAQQEINVELLKSQLDSMFEVFGEILNYLKSGNVDQKSLIGHNDCAVSLLKLFGKTCEKYKKKKEINTLRATYNYFDYVRSSIDVNDAKIVKFWFEYIDAALTSKQPLNKLRISKQTIDFAKNNTRSKLPDFLNVFLGANHETTNTINKVKQNYDHYRQQNQAAIKKSQQVYDQRQQTVKCPTQNDMYNVSGGGQHIEFGSSIAAFGKYSQQHQQNNNDVNDNKDNNQMGGGGKGGVNISNITNGFIKKPPPQPLKRNNVAIPINFPIPCQIQAALPNNQVGVELARPYDDIRAKIHISNIEINPNAVYQLEQQYIQKRNGQPLGYMSLKQKQIAIQKQSNPSGYQ